MASIQTLEQRLRAVEARLSEIEGGYGDTLYQHTRQLLALRLDMGKLMRHMRLDPTTDEEIDAALDEEGA